MTPGPHGQLGLPIAVEIADRQTGADRAGRVREVRRLPAVRKSDSAPSIQSVRVSVEDNDLAGRAGRDVIDAVVVEITDDQRITANRLERAAQRFRRRTSARRPW